MMKHAPILFLLSILTVLSPMMAQDTQVLSERDISGTARYTAMAGAMTAVGADPSAVLDNPAGLGLYRRPEVSITLANQMDYTCQMGYGRMLENRFMVPQINAVFAYQRNAGSGGLEGFAFMLSFNRLKVFNRTSEAGYGASDYSLTDAVATQLNGLPEDKLQYKDGSSYDPWSNPDVGWLGMLGYNTYVVNPSDNNRWSGMIGGGLARQAAGTIRIQEYGYMDEFAINWGGNIGHRFYMGLGLNVRSLSYRKSLQYNESYSLSAREQMNMYLSSTLMQDGIGVNGTFGFIYRPIQLLRIGASIQTPTAMKLTTRTSGRMTAYDSESITPADPAYSFKMTMPLRVTAGVALQCRQFGLLSFEYDYRHQLELMDVHTLKVGAEAVVANNLFLNAGYACESTFRTEDWIYGVNYGSVRTDADFRHMRLSHYVGAGLGYRGQSFIVQLAYQWRMQRWHLYAHECQLDAFDMQSMSHRIVLTLGWHGARQ